MDWTLAGQPLLRGRLTAPLGGRWVATLEADTDDAIAGAVVLSIGGVQWRGTVHRGGNSEGVWRGKVVGGAGGLDRAVVARSWRGLQPARGLLVELLGEVGEALADASGPEVDANLARWARLDCVAVHALADLARAVGARWRVTPEGTVWVGNETWPELVTPEGALTEFLADDPADGTATYALSGAYVVPGQTFEGRRVSAVEYELEGGRDRATVWLADG